MSGSGPIQPVDTATASPNTAAGCESAGRPVATADMTLADGQRPLTIDGIIPTRNRRFAALGATP